LLQRRGKRLDSCANRDTGNTSSTGRLDQSHLVEGPHRTIERRWGDRTALSYPAFARVFFSSPRIIISMKLALQPSSLIGPEAREICLSKSIAAQQSHDLLAAEVKSAGKLFAGLTLRARWTSYYGCQTC
jgi:hypothetical protein